MAVLWHSCSPQHLDWLSHRVMPAEALQLTVEQLGAPLHEDRARLVVHNKHAAQPAPAEVACHHPALWLVVSSERTERAVLAESEALCWRPGTTSHLLQISRFG